MNFYAVVICVILSQIGYDPLALFLSISGVILGFAFMIGSASSKYFEVSQKQERRYYTDLQHGLNLLTSLFWIYRVYSSYWCGDHFK